MAKGVAGSYTLTGDSGSMARISYEETYDIAGNFSTLPIKLEVASSWYSGVTYYMDGTISIDGNAIVTMKSSAGSHGAYLPAKNTYVNVTGSPYASGNIVHNTDGSREVTISIDIRGYTTSGGAGSGWHISDTRKVTLTAIPRASTIGATDANIGSVSMIAVNKKREAYTHSIQYKFGELSGYITAAGGISGSEVKFGGVSVAFSVPESFYTQIPNSKTGQCILTIRTYSGSVQIGDEQTCTFLAMAAESVCSPSVVGTVVDSNAATKTLTGNENTLVRFYSTALCTISAAAKNSASITLLQINGVTPTDGQVSIPSVETGIFVFTAIDSRGYSTSVVVELDMVQYILLTNNASAARTDPTSGNAVLTIKGDFFNGSFGAAGNVLSVSYTVDGGNAVSVTPTIDGNKYTASVNLSGLDYQSEHEIIVTAVDSLASTSKKVKIYRGIPILDWGESDVNFNVPIKINKSPLIDIIYPVGSIYMSVNNVSPQSFLGGIWERIQDRFLLAAGSAYSPGTTGGEASHTLTVNEMPSHAHNYGTWRNCSKVSGTSNKMVEASAAVVDNVPGTMAAGGGAAHNNMPPYLAVYVWKRTS